VKVKTINNWPCSDVTTTLQNTAIVSERLRFFFEIKKSWYYILKAGCTWHASCAFFEHTRLISWRHVLFWCVWYGRRSSKSESEQWVWCINIETGSYSNADHTRRIRRGREVTKSDACAQKTRRTHAVCIQLDVPALHRGQKPEA